MAHASYPSATDLSAFIAAAGKPVAGLSLAQAIQSAVAAFEHETHRRFIAAVGTRYFDLPDGNGVISLREEIATVAGMSLTLNGSPLVINSDYWVEPYDAEERGMPYDRVTLRAVWANTWIYNRRRAIAITAKWGYSLTIPEDVWDAMLCGGALRLIADIAERATKGFVSVSEEGASESYGSEPLATLEKRWQGRWDRAVATYKDVRFFH